MNWIARAARIGYAAKGATYVLIAVLALQAAVAHNTQPENTRGALRSINEPGSGKILLLLIGVGLGAYAIWKFYIVVADPENGGLNKRITALFVAFTNGGFAVQAFTLGLSLRASQNDGDQAVHWSTVLMSHRAGAIAVAVAGGFIGLYGVEKIIRALRRKVDDHLRRLKLDRTAKRWVVTACKFGIAARGVVFLLVGWFLVRAAIHINPGEARDFGRSLQELARQPMGRSLLFVVAVGLLAYGAYQFLRARFDRFPA